MNKPLVSVVVPVYNVEDYLEKCVQSIREQTLRDIEIILVDDGATDQSGIICDQLASQDSRIKVIHKKNGGLSDARNVGMAKAQADYIGFVDSDDYIAPTMYEHLYQAITSQDADLAYCSFYDVINGKEIPRFSADPRKKVINQIQAIKKLLMMDKLTYHAWNKLYKTEIVKRHLFPIGKYYEDVTFFLSYLLDCQRIVGSTEPLYYYLKREGSIVNRSYSSKDLDVILAHDTNYEVLKDIPELAEPAAFRAIWSRYFVLDRMMKSNQPVPEQDKNELKKWIKSHWRLILTNRYIPRGRKLALAGLLVNEKLYQFAIGLRKK